jgi:peptide-methionine (S)-S-oxide reductase
MALPNLEVITLGGGCFWCTEAAFSELKGVEKVEPGYSGGNFPNPSYEEVCTGRTGHAEVVQLTYDPTVISLREILQVFFTIYDPTTPNRQGADIGPQYRSVIFYHNAEQKEVAQQVINEVAHSGVWNKSIVTQLIPFEVFYTAEGYHRAYFKQNPRQPYCQVVIAPKVAKLRKFYREKLKSPEISG